MSDSQWIQTSLPVRDGGLGVRRVSQLAIPASIASAASTLSIQDDNQIANFSRAICRPGQRNMVMSTTPNLLNSLSWIALVCLRTRRWWKPV